MKYPILAAGLLLGASVPLVASTARRPERAPAPSAEAELYRIDPVHSGALFRITHFGVSAFWGRFNSVNGEFTLDADHPEGSSVFVTIAADSIDTNSADRDNHVKSPDFFNAKEHPEITFTSTAVSAAGEDAYRVKGTLAFHGVEKEVELEAHRIGRAEVRGGVRCGFEGELTIDRRDFGVTTFTGPSGLGNEVRIVVFAEGMKD